MKLLLIVSALTAVALASDDYAAASAYKDNSYGAYVYHGKYPGNCGNDGLYYKDEASFVFCSNGNSYEQPCAPGTRNSAYGKYSSGGKYDYRDFCDVNLVDHGYAAKKSSYAPKPAADYPLTSESGKKDGYAADAKYDYGYAGRDYGYDRRDYGYGHRYYGYGYPNYGYGYQPYGYPY